MALKYKNKVHSIYIVIVYDTSLLLLYELKP